MAKKTALEKLAAASVSAFERKEHRPNAAFDITRCELVDENNRKLDWNIFGALEEAPVELTITGASTVTLTVDDPSFELLNDPIFSKWMFKKQQVSKSSARTFSNRKITDSSHTARYGEETEEEWTLPERPIDLNLDGIWFRLCGFQGNETKLTLKFEDRVAAILRQEIGSLVTVNRGAFTRAGFIEKLAKLAEHNHKAYGKIPLFIPEAAIHQVVAENTAAEKASDLKSSAAVGIGTGDGLTIGGTPATPNQIAVLNELLEGAVEVKAPFKAQAAMVYAAFGETKAGADAGTYSPNSANCSGVLQEKEAPDPHDTKGMAKRFMLGSAHFQGGGAINLVRTQPHATIPEIAVVVEVPSIWPANAYAAEEGSGSWVAEAEHAVRLYGGAAAGEAEGIGTVAAPYAFTRGPAETSWDCIQRLASEVSWYAFVRENVLWYVSGDFLFAQVPQLHVQRGRNGIDWVNPDIEVGARDRTAEIEVKGRATPWTAVPGNCVNVARVGPANGRWIVDTVTLDVLDHSDALTAKLMKPLPARPEPAAGTVESTPGEATGSASKGSALAAFNAADTMSRMQLPYQWGGGHQANGLENARAGGPGFDCSGSTCWVLKQAGMFPGTSAVVSGELEHWGAPGKGKEMTVWARADHVFIEYNIPGHGRAQFNTNHAPPSGPRLFTLSQQQTYDMTPDSEGFVPRHWPGT